MLAMDETIDELMDELTPLYSLELYLIDEEAGVDLLLRSEFLEQILLIEYLHLRLRIRFEDLRYVVYHNVYLLRNFQL